MEKNCLLLKEDKDLHKGSQVSRLTSVNLLVNDAIPITNSVNLLVNDGMIDDREYDELRPLAALPLNTQIVSDIQKEMRDNNKAQKDIDDMEEYFAKHGKGVAGLKEKKVGKNQKFRLIGKNFFLTYPKCDIAREEAAKLLKEKVKPLYLHIAREAHQDGTHHLHVLVSVTIKIDTQKPNYFDIAGEHGNYQSCRNTDWVLKYIQKSDETPFVEGKYQGNTQSAVQKRAQTNAMLAKMTVLEMADQGLIHITQYAQVKKSMLMYKLDSRVVADNQPKKCIWIQGPTGCGKSRYVRDNYPESCFTKPQNKWWDGYNDQKIILIDDFDHNGYHCGHLLKIWGDRYSFIGEAKGTTIKPEYTHFFITSQYSPEQIWDSDYHGNKRDAEMVEAIKRRFTICTIENDHDLVLVHQSTDKNVEDSDINRYLNN